MMGNGNNPITIIVAIVALIGGIGAIILPMRGSIEDVNVRLTREVIVLERELLALDDKLQIEISSADALSFERHVTQGEAFIESIKAADGKLQAEIALISAQTEISIASLTEKIKSLRELLAIERLQK